MSTLRLAIGSLFPPAEPGVSFCQPSKKIGALGLQFFVLERGIATASSKKVVWSVGKAKEHDKILSKTKKSL